MSLTLVGRAHWHQSRYWRNVLCHPPLAPAVGRPQPTAVVRPTPVSATPYPWAEGGPSLFAPPPPPAIAPAMLSAVSLSVADGIVSDCFALPACLVALALTLITATNMVFVKCDRDCGQGVAHWADVRLAPYLPDRWFVVPLNLCSCLWPCTLSGRHGLVERRDSAAGLLIPSTRENSVPGRPGPNSRRQWSLTSGNVALAADIFPVVMVLITRPLSQVLDMNRLHKHITDVVTNYSWPWWNHDRRLG